jgi:hypothetical protein
MSILPMSIFAQGSLTPLGAPAATFKTLQQIEPRIDLQNAPGSAVTTSNANYHFIINQPGSPPRVTFTDPRRKIDIYSVEERAAVSE